MNCLSVVYIDWTVPFYSAVQRTKHFLKHGHEFGAVDEHEYEKLADFFMSMPPNANLYECVNPTGTNDRNRLDGITLHFGVDFSRGIRTFHIRGAFSIAHRGGPRGFVNHKCAEIYS
jgi:hypothetical protein